MAKSASPVQGLSTAATTRKRSAAQAEEPAPSLSPLSIFSRIRAALSGPASPADSSRPETPANIDPASAYDIEEKVEAEAAACGGPVAAPDDEITAEHKELWGAAIEDDAELGSTPRTAAKAGKTPGGKVVRRPRTHEEKFKAATDALITLIGIMSKLEDKLLKQKVYFMDALRRFLLERTGNKKQDLTQAKLDAELKRLKEEDQFPYLLRLALRRVLGTPESADLVRGYQLDGIQFMVLRSLSGNGVLLADEMGLGKTLQIISTIALLHHVCWGINGVSNGVYLIVCPCPLKSNWQKEIEKWLGDKAELFVYHGYKDERPELQRELRAKAEERRRAFDAAKRARDAVKTTDAYIKADGEGKKALLREAGFAHRPARPLFVVTTQSMVKIAHEAWFLHSLAPSTVVNDEAHSMKNAESVSFANMNVVGRGAWRILLTGTPLSNNVDELFTLLNFVNAELFPRSTPLAEILKHDQLHSKQGRDELVAAERSDGVITKLHRLCEFVMLRRLKEQVPDLNLPERREVVLLAPPTERQAAWFAAIAQAVLHEHMKHDLESTPMERQKAKGKGKGRGRPPARQQHKAEEGEEEGEEGEEERPGKRARYGARLAAQATEEQREAFRASRLGVDVREEGTRTRAARARERSDAGLPPPEAQSPEEAGMEVSAPDGYSAHVPTKLVAKMQRAWHVQLQVAMDTPLALDGQWEGHIRRGEDPTPDEMVSLSGKFAMLERVLPALRARGHRVLLFSRYVEVLGVLAEYLRGRGYEFRHIDGSMNMGEKDEQIKDFQERDDVFALLSTTKTGGLGLNLVQADTVILFDSDYNPQNDLQAMDRAHRIGQTKPVLVLRLITPGANSLELELLGVASGKKCVEDILVVEHEDTDGRGEERRAEERLKASMDSLNEFVQQARGQREAGPSEASLARVLDRARPLEELAVAQQGYIVVRRSRRPRPVRL